MGRGYRKRQGQQEGGIRGVSGDGEERIRNAHYDEHRQNVWEAIKEASSIVADSVGGRSEDLVKAIGGAGLAGIAASVGAATISPAAALIAPAAGAYIGWRAYRSWNTSLRWKNSVIGRALAKTFGTNQETGAINSISRIFAERSLASLGAASASSLALGTPIAPVAIAAIGGYAAYKGVRFAMNRKKAEEEMNATPEEAAPQEKTTEEPTKTPASEDAEAPAAEGAEAPAAESAEENTTESTEEAPAPEEPTEDTEEPMLPQDMIALALAKSAEQEAEKNLPHTIEHELGSVAAKEGRNFVEGQNPEAIEARTLTYLAQSIPVEGSEREEEIRALVAKLEANYFAESPEGKAAIEALTSKLDSIEARKAEIEARVAEINRSLALAKHNGHFTLEMEEAAEREVEALREEYESQEPEYLQAATRLDALNSPKIGEVDGLINLSTSGNSLICARCGTKPKTVRISCSKCGLPFVASPKYREYVGIGEKGLREKGKMDLIEKYEGDEETRKEFWAARGEGKIPVRKASAETTDLDQGGPPRQPANKAASQNTNSSRNAVQLSKWSAEETLADLQPQGEYDRKKYLADQAALRSGDDPRQGTFLVGHDKIANKYWKPGGENADLEQGEAMMRGVMGWDWNTNSASRNIQPGDTVVVRKNGNTDRGAKIDGSFTVGEKIVLNLPSLKDLKETPGVSEKIAADGLEAALRQYRPELMAVIDGVADRIMESTDGEYYPRERLMENILGEIKASQTTAISFLQVTNPQELDDYYDPALMGGNDNLGLGVLTLNGSRRSASLVADADAIEKRVRGGSKIKRAECKSDEEYDAKVQEEVERKMKVAEEGTEATEKLLKTIEGKRADEVEANGGSYPQKNFNRDAKGRPRVCGVRTAMGTPCRNPAARGSNYCWQHPNGPQKERGEQALTREEIDLSARNALNRELVERAPAAIAGRDEAAAYIETLDNDPASETNQELIAQCGMTERELAEYANTFLESCRPDEDDIIAVSLHYENQIPLAKAIASVADARGMGDRVKLWYPPRDSKQFEDRQKLLSNPNFICASLDQVGPEGKRIIAGKNTEYEELTEENKPINDEGEKYTPFNPFGGDRWNVTMSPTKEWAATLAANHRLTGFSSDPDKALRQLGQDLYRQARADQGIDGSRQNVEILEGRAARMKDLDIKDIEIEVAGEDGSPGTNLKMSLTEESTFMTVDMNLSESGEGKDILLNNVTEEVFASPDAGSLRGHFTSTAPTNLTGTDLPDEEPLIIEQIRGKFDEKTGELDLKAFKQDENGQWVEDKEGQEKMDKFFFGEGGRPTIDGKPAPFPQCGEVGLVDSDNPVASTGRRYLIPMIDEHGGLHIAIGGSYAQAGGGSATGASPTYDEAAAKIDQLEKDLKSGKISEEQYHQQWSIAHSQTKHVDITIGSGQADVRGHSRKTGEWTSLLGGGSWAI